MSVKKKLSIPVQVEVQVDARDAYTESLKMILQHVADFHITVVDIISEKYKIPVDEIMNTITSDSRYSNMLVDPKIHRLTATALNQDHVETTETTETIGTTAVTTVETIPVTQAPVTKKIIEKKIKIKPKIALATTTSTTSTSS
jgi:hypothetical protein